MAKKVRMIETLLSKPSSKPDYSFIPKSDVLKRAQVFLPSFISNTDKILSDPHERQMKQMDIAIQRQDDFKPQSQSFEKTSNVG